MEPLSLLREKVFEMKSTQWQMIIKTSQFFLWKLERLYFCLLFLQASFLAASEKPTPRTLVKTNIGLVQNGKLKTPYHSRRMGVQTLFRWSIKLAHFISTIQKMMEACDNELKPAHPITFKIASDISIKRPKIGSFFLSAGKVLLERSTKVNISFLILARTQFLACETWLSETDDESF